MKVFLFSGAGASVELGVPAMRQMAEELLDHLETESPSTPFVVALRQRLVDTGGDLELLLDDIDKICGAGPVLAAFGSTVPEALGDSAATARSEIEWFVQHSCERVRAESAAALWLPMLREPDLDLTIATTNYDRSVELAAVRGSIDIVDGFGPYEGHEWAAWTGSFGPGLKLLKLHGSTDWYQVTSSPQVAKLRHPMPLFGGVSLHLRDGSLGELGSALVLPSREKRKNAPPFPSISHEMFVAAREADVVVFVGTSLRDPDVQALADECASRVPTIIAGPDVRRDQPGVPSAAVLFEAYAAEFLVSTLPGLLRKQALPEPGSEHRGDQDQPMRSILDDVVALRSALPDTERCRAIEALWGRKVSLGSDELTALLGSGNGPVAVDALGLVALSRDRDALVDHCSRLATSSSDANFSRDFNLLSRRD